MNRTRPDGEALEVVADDGCHLRVWQHGPSSEPVPITFVHGLGSSSLDWSDSIEHFVKRGRRVLSLDLRGHGQSENAPRPLSVNRHARDVVAVLDALHVDQTDLVGLSLGGQIGLEVAAIAPDHIHRLVVACCAIDTRRHRPKVLIQWVVRSVVLHGLGLGTSTRVLANELFPKPEQQELREEFEEAWLENDLSAYRSALQGAFGWNARNRLGHMTGPVLIVGADRDMIPLSEFRAIQSEFADARIEIVKDCGHAIPVERPDDWNALLDAFLSSESVGV